MGTGCIAAWTAIVAAEKAATDQVTEPMRASTDLIKRF